MKKVFCLLLCVLLCASLVSCGKQEKEAASDSKGEIDSYAQNGEIPELTIKLGSTPDEAKQYYSTAATEQENEDLVLFETEGVTAVNLSNGQHSFYYEKINAQYGISVIAVMGGSAYGLEIGYSTTQNDVIAKLDAQYTVSSATADRLYFLPGAVDGGEILSCSYENIRLDFFFFDGYLSAVTLTNTAYWTD